jgi:hypothetical protein
MDTSFTRFNKKFERREFNRFWDDISCKSSDNESTIYIRIGKHISRYIHSKYFKELNHTFEWEFEGTTFLCKNDTCGNSWCFENLIEKYPAVIRFQYSGKTGKWMYSVYSSEKSTFNCEDFCERFGGGGHLHAAGFSTEQLIFTNPPKKSTKPIIFLGGTCNGDEWRSEFIKHWKDTAKHNEVLNDFELFNPIITDRQWTKADEDKENEIKEKACINLFLISPNTSGFYSIAEAIESANNSAGKTIFAVCDKHYDTRFTDSRIRSFDAIGNLVEKHGGVYITANGEDAIKTIVKEVIQSLADAVKTF